MNIRKKLQSLFIKSYIECSASTISKAFSRLQNSAMAMGINSTLCMYKLLKTFRRGSKRNTVDGEEVDSGIKQQ